MNKKFFTLITLLFLSISMFAQQQTNTPYDFPVKPGSEQWAAFTTGQQMVDACQIPEDVLSQLSTEALAETCMNYPLYFEYLSSNNERTGIAYLISSFNGLQELSKRADGASALIKIYTKLPINTASLAKTVGQSRNMLHLGYVELLLADNAFFNKISTSELNELKKVVVAKYAEKVKENKSYSLLGIQKSLLLGARIIEKTDNMKRSAAEKSTIQNFIKFYGTSDNTYVTEMSKILCE